MLVSMVVCPTCDEPMHAGPALVNGRVTFVLTCFHCPLISELTPECPARLRDFDGHPTMDEAAEHGIVGPLVRNTKPIPLGRRES